MKKSPAEIRLHLRGLAVGLLMGLGIGLAIAHMPLWLIPVCVCGAIGLYIFNISSEDLV